MYFPEDMTFQYFFFDTYVGYFLQALPFALAAGGIYGFVRYRNDRETPVSRKLFSCIFVCYITGLICLVVGLDLMRIFWYELFYPMDSSIEIRFFSGEFDLVPDFFGHIGGETIGNFLMFLPFGFLYPLSRTEPRWRKTVATGVLLVMAIEVLQPVFGRAFDMNDVILNIAAITISASAFFAAERLFNKKSK